MNLPATKGITVVSGCGANESVMESTHQWITTVVIIHTLLRRWPLAGWWLLMRIWSEPSTLALSSTPPSTALCGCQATALWGGKGLVEAFELMVRMPQSVHSVLAKLQPTTTVEPRRGKILKNDRNTNILSPRQLLAASRITEALDKCVSNRSGWGGGLEYERCDLQEFVCVGGAALLPRGSFLSWRALLSFAYFHSCSGINRVFIKFPP